MILSNSQGGENDPSIALDINAALVDVDGSENLSINISGLPDGVDLNAGVDNGDGSWTVGPDDLDGLAMQLSGGDIDTNNFDLTIEATSTESSNADAASTVGTINVMISEELNQITGTSGNDTIKGTGDADEIYGLAGNDRIQGKGGDDTIYGGEGNDNIKGGSGDDTLYGDKGNDTIRGGSGDDVLYGGEGSDTLKGDNILQGGSGSDIIYGGEGDDVAKGQSGDDLFIFGQGNGADTFDGGKGGG